MAIEFSCTCGKKYKVRDELAGRGARCALFVAAIVVEMLHSPILLLLMLLGFKMAIDVLRYAGERAMTRSGVTVELG
jgi:hypothetical protein